MNQESYVVMQRNSRGTVSLASGQLSSYLEAQAVIARLAGRTPGMDFQVVRMTVVSDWQRYDD